jgi:hypothetical protein
MSAWTGIAATLLPLGKTIHSFYQLPLNFLGSDLQWNIVPSTIRGRAMKATHVHMIDEGSMVSCPAAEVIHTNTHTHTYTHYYTIILSSYHTIILSYYQTIIKSYYHTIILSYYCTMYILYIYTHIHTHTIILSYYHTIILSYYHTIVLYICCIYFV